MKGVELGLLHGPTINNEIQFKNGIGTLKMGAQLRTMKGEVADAVFRSLTTLIKLTRNCETIGSGFKSKRK